ncbi:LysR family transcriptional regulator [Amycolatopsis sp. MtRt-6]|uniref:LysR family transcriptional regulator n=1 Tax=Amycolatopsis sp. MtRt-6 TaxID=2792782 RepID=UPI001A8D8575|nr:LysR family transcriptional regulator [Amycolatopsis sp. MtRt-6]
MTELKYKIPDRVTLDRLATLVALHDHAGSVADTAGAIKRSESSVKNHIRELEQDLGGGHLVVRTNGSMPITPHGEEIVRRAKELLERASGLARVGRKECTVAFLPQHAHIVAKAMKELTRTTDILLRLEVLAEHHRSRVGFEQHVLAPLAHGALDLVIGLPTTGKGLATRPLYRTRLVAMVPRRNAPEHLPLARLVREHKLLVPPADTRSRVLLDGEIEAHIPAELRSRKHIELEAYGTKVLTIFAYEGHGTVVAPEDIAQPFMSDKAFGGSPAADFAWVPVTVDESGEPLTHRVVVTMPANAGQRQRDLESIVKALQDASAALDVGTDGHSCNRTPGLRRDPQGSQE